MNAKRLGIYVASVTPFTSEDKFNPDALVALMERNLREGASGFSSEDPARSVFSFPIAKGWRCLKQPSNSRGERN